MADVLLSLVFFGGGEKWKRLCCGVVSSSDVLASPLVYVLNFVGCILSTAGLLDKFILLSPSSITVDSY